MDSAVSVVARDHNNLPQIRLDEVLLGSVRIFVTQPDRLGQFHLGVWREPRNATHLVDVDSHRIIRIDGIADLFGGLQLIDDASAGSTTIPMPALSIAASTSSNSGPLS